MRVIVGCEESQAVCKAFRERGHEAYSCDSQPCSGGHPEWHFQEDIFEVLEESFDLGIFHPPCTRLCNSGVRWLHERNLWDELNKASDFFFAFVKLALKGDIKKVCIENPIPHKYALLPKYTQIIHPWMFGHPERKATCLWLYNLPMLKPTNIVEGREQRIWKLSPGINRSKLRSKTFPGIAAAMAEQWG